MPDEIPRYCVKCGRNYFARYDVIDAQILVWCPAKTCREMQHTIPIYGFHARPASQQRQVAEMVERTETETNESQGSDFLKVHLALAEVNDTMIPCLAAGAAGLMIGADLASHEGDVTAVQVTQLPNCKLSLKPITFSEEEMARLAKAQQQLVAGHLAAKIAGASICKPSNEWLKELANFGYKPLGLSEKNSQCLALTEPPKWNELGVPPALLQPESINMATARALNPSLDDLAAMEREIELLRRVRNGK